MRTMWEATTPSGRSSVSVEVTPAHPDPSITVGILLLLRNRRAGDPPMRMAYVALPVRGRVPVGVSLFVGGRVWGWGAREANARSAS